MTVFPPELQLVSAASPDWTSPYVDVQGFDAVRLTVYCNGDYTYYIRWSMDKGINTDWQDTAAVTGGVTTSEAFPIRSRYMQVYIDIAVPNKQLRVNTSLKRATDVGTSGAISPSPSPAPGTYTLINTQTFTVVGTTSWTKPAGALYIDMILIGGGQGGGSGRRGAAGTTRYGGVGGSNGMVCSILNYSVSLLPNATYDVTVPSGGAGAIAPTVDSTNGNNGTNGGDCLFDNGRFRAYGGGRLPARWDFSTGDLTISNDISQGLGAGGGTTQTVSSTLYTVPIVTMDFKYSRTLAPEITEIFPVFPNSSSSVDQNTPNPYLYPSPTMGGYGSTISSANLTYTSGASPAIAGYYLQNVGSAAVVVAGQGVDGAGFLTPPGITLGMGGSGSMGNATGSVSYRGGHGGLYGGGGGGANAFLNGTTGASGGDGAQGCCVIYTYG